MEKKVYTFSNDTGDATMTVYTVFPGIQLVYHSVHMDYFNIGMVTEGNLIELQHCREGRIEQQFEDEYFYLMPGDLSVALRTKPVDGYHFPLCHYHGITIGIDRTLAEHDVSPLLREIQVQPKELAERLCGDKNSFIIRSEQAIEHIFSELYHVPENIKPGYFKVKVLELLLVLSGRDWESRYISEITLNKSQVSLAHRATAYLLEHMEQHITIQMLAKVLNVSDTYLKRIFKAVYGVPVFSYMRIQKMQSAAQLLIHTERPVAEIAYDFGYNNTSKFSVAFQKVMGDTPGEYRRMHTKTEGRDLL